MAVIADIERLLPRARRATSRSLLEAELATRRKQLAASPEPPLRAAAPPPQPLRKESVVAPTGPVFVKIDKYAWDQSKKFVKVYMTLPGIENVPDASVRLDAQPTALTFEVSGLSPPRRLAVPTLHSAVDPAQCTWARKSDSMVLLKLRKANDGDEWGSLDDSALLQARRKAEKVEGNKGKSTAEVRRVATKQATSRSDARASPRLRPPTHPRSSLAACGTPTPSHTLRLGGHTPLLPFVHLSSTYII